MEVRKLTRAETVWVRSPGQDGEVFVGDLIGPSDGGPITVGFGRYGPHQSITETMTVDDVMIVLEGELSVSDTTGTVTAGPGEIVYMPTGQQVTISSHDQGAVTAYVTYPHWSTARK